MTERSGSFKAWGGSVFFHHFSLGYLNEGPLVEKPFRRILIIKMRFHGDMLLTTPVISTLKHHYPDAKIDVLLYEDTIPILSENPEINELYGLKNKKSGLREKIVNFYKLIKELNKNHYDLVINMADQWLVALVVRMLNAPVCISHDFGHRQNRFWRKSFTHLVKAKGDNIVESNLSVLEPLGLDPYVSKTTMSYPQSSWHKVRAMLDDSGVGQRFVVIQPTARQIFKCWDNEKFSLVIDALHQRGLEVVLTSGPSQSDLACIDAISKGCQVPPVTALAGKMTFPELAALIDHAELFLGVDSAPGHISAALNTPMICLFGATNHIFWRPWSNNMIQFWAGDYQRMPSRDQLDRGKMYLSVIPADDVIVAIDTMLLKNSDLSTTGVDR